MPGARLRRVAQAVMAAILIGQASCGGDPGTPVDKTPASNIRESDIQAALESAETYMVTGRSPEARAILTVLTERAAEDWRAHEMLGRLHFRLAADAMKAGLSEQAQLYHRRAYNSYLQACLLSPEDVNLQQSAGEIAVVAGLPSDSLMHFKEAVGLEPLNPRAALLYGQQLLSLGQEEAARSMLEQVLVLDPGEVYAHATLALIDSQHGNRESAVEHIAIALKNDPTNTGIRLVEAKVYRSLDEPQMILERLGPLSKTQRAHPGMAYELAWAWKQLGRPRPAAEAWILVFDASPTHPDAWQWARDAAIGLREAGDEVAAGAWQRKAELLSPRDVRFDHE